MDVLNNSFQEGRNGYFPLQLEPWNHSDQNVLSNEHLLHCSSYVHRMH